jgi:hypothetical protein
LRSDPPITKARLFFARASMPRRMLFLTAVKFQWANRRLQQLTWPRQLVRRSNVSPELLAVNPRRPRRRLKN